MAVVAITVLHLNQLKTIRMDIHEVLKPEGLPRKFNTVELMEIKELKEFMKNAWNAESWNRTRDEAKKIWSEKIISAVDGLRKWIISYDKPTKNVTYMGLKIA